MTISTTELSGSGSSNWRAHESIGGGALLNASAPDFTPAPSQAQAVQSLLAVGPTHVNITAERENSSVSPEQPAFLKDVRFESSSPYRWYQEVLPYLSKCTFVIASTADVAYGRNIFGSAALQHIYNAITIVELPKFYWFSGVTQSRPHNPYLHMCRNLPNLRTLSLTMQTAGLTTQRWTERQIITFERDNPEAAKERILLSLREVVLRYQLNALFACASLRHIRLEYIDSAMTRYFCRVGNPIDVLRDIKLHLEQGFAQRGLEVVVELVRVFGETLG